MFTNQLDRTDWRHFKFMKPGGYLESIRKELKIPKQVLCAEGSFSLTTYYKMLNGYDHNLNFYVRLLIVLSRNSNPDPDTWKELVWQFFTLACSEIQPHMKDD